MDFAQDLRGKRVVVTGACGVIGRWIVASFAGAGARLCLTDGHAAALAELAAATDLGEGGFTQVADLGDAASITALAEAVGARWGAADVLVNNAGVYPSGFLLDIDAAEWDRVMGINLRAPFLLTRALARQMVDQGVKGNIINISSGAARKMRRSVVPYCVSKTALDRLTKGFALELAEYGIRVNALEPGFAPGSSASPLTAAHVAATTANIPLGRGTSAEDIGNALLYLASSAAAYVTGATLSVDGGNSIGTLAVYQDKKSAL
ncbi:SDR family oxidoreductase [Roseomonas sp. GC11]|uniref:SDR family NAD(P)-dependent oxidoreductase n=1 Tax=Roseomonas sp. GC11 TaxID=2950546 RepID=UPI00210D6A0E|nr:SDR family oxidoreductase [Roseomonas sp. GC11]MCQ4162349.1 SDR family oxidoreductase [Roseomonas sp. GC11]